MLYLLLQILIVPEYLIFPIVYFFFHCVKTLDLEVEFAFLGHPLDLITEEVLSCLLLDDMGGFRPYPGQSLA